MDAEVTDPDPTLSQQSERQRLIEGWLPLAQEANQFYGWRLDGATIEQLIALAAPTLAQAESVLAARAILWSVYRRYIA